MLQVFKTIFGLSPPLQSGEKNLYFKPIVWAVSAKSLPSYRISVSCPLLLQIGLLVTDRRVVLTCRVLGFFRLDWTAWFAETNSREDHLETVSTGCNRLFGPYLELSTRNPVRHWWRSSMARIRVCMKDPESIRRLISEASRSVSKNL
jgi:hypothetical protein